MIVQWRAVWMEGITVGDSVGGCQSCERSHWVTFWVYKEPKRLQKQQKNLRASGCFLCRGRIQRMRPAAITNTAFYTYFQLFCWLQKQHSSQNQVYKHDDLYKTVEKRTTAAPFQSVSLFWVSPLALIDFLWRCKSLKTPHKGNESFLRRVRLFPKNPRKCSSVMEKIFLSLAWINKNNHYTTSCSC